MSVTQAGTSVGSGAKSIEQICINTMRTLSMDAVQAANSGHPGTPMALAPVAYVLWQEFLRYDPADPLWPNRDRFVLSAGHASMMLYSVLHLARVKNTEDGRVLDEPSVSLDEIKRFRQIGSRTAGHPEYGLTTGVEATTGPLGQGVAMSVGMAIAGRWRAAHFNQAPYENLFNFNVYSICSDGDMMEGISSEAASLAGHLKLSNLCWIYDNNHITIEGRTRLAFTEEIGARFLAYGWNVAHVTDANDLEMIRGALRKFASVADRPTFIIVNSHIGWGSPHKQDTKEAHGEALGEEEVRLTKRVYGWPEDAKFLVPDGVYQHFQDGIGKRGRELRDAWTAQFRSYQTDFPAATDEILRMEHRQLPDGWDNGLPTFAADAKGMATRESSNKVENAIGKNVPWLVGGAADLSPSTKTLMTFDGQGDLEADTPGGRNLHFGIREHNMAAIVNGMTLTDLRAYGATFFVFTDYMRGAMRLSAVMDLPVIYILTHDSIGLGEDGTTHQPIEHLAMFRATPRFTVFRPADANEVLEAWKVIMPMRRGPVMLVLTRQGVPTLDRSKYGAASGVARGAYVLAGAPDARPDVILMGTGSEVSLCVEAYEQLVKEGIKARVVSMPSWELFEHQDQQYRDAVLPPAVTARVSVEAASTFGWSRYVGTGGASIGMHSFGESAPAKDLYKHFDITAQHVVSAAKEQLQKSKQ